MPTKRSTKTCGSSTGISIFGARACSATFALRHRIIKAMRDFFDSRGFLEIETPMLIKSTPEGARDYLVPSRLYPGQLLCAAAIAAAAQADPDDRRLRKVHADRALHARRGSARRPSGGVRAARRRALVLHARGRARSDGVVHALRLADGAGHRGAAVSRGSRIKKRLAKYGVDKPDLRFGLELADATAIFAGTEFGVFRSAIEAGGAVVALRYPGGAALSRRDFDALTETAKEFGGKGMVWIALGADGVKSSAAKFLNRRADPARRAALGAADRRCAAALRRRARACVRGRRQDAQRGRRALQTARSRSICVRVGDRFSVS